MNPLCHISSPRVSVVIPAYNYASYLTAAIESALEQDYPSKEIIVVDDGSTDETRRVVSRYGQSVRYVYQANVGLSAARNTGISVARCPFVAFLDADDLWMPSMLSTLMSTFSKSSDDYVVVACRHENVDDDGQLLPKRWHDRGCDREVLARDVLVKNRFCADAVVVKRKALRACGGFDTQLRSSEDRDMWIRLTRFGRLFLMDQALLRVRVHSGSMSTNADRMKRYGRVVLGKAYQAGAVPRRRISVWARALSFHCFQSAWMYYDEKRPARATQEMLRSIAYWPWFPRPSLLDEPILFRIRALRRFLAFLFRRLLFPRK